MAKGLAEVLSFGRYEPLFRIGVGGMAEVYAARIRGEAGFQKLVAVKRMLPHLSGDQRFVDMFLDEARLAAIITSPHVVQTLDLGRTDDDALYIVMELIVGVTLAEVMRSRVHLDPPVALSLLAQAAQGLDDAHEARAPSGEALHLVHRDVSPQNIIIGIDGRARVSDFGIAHAMTERRTHTRVGEVKGKFSYFSPEQARGLPVDRRSDVFSLGIVAWELLTGRRLFKEDDPAQTLAAVREKEVPELRELRPDLGADVSRAIMTALERDADQRHATAGQMATALRRSALYFGEPPSPRVVGSLVEEVGGDGLSRIQKRLSSAGAPESVTGTLILPEHAGPASHTESLDTDDLIEQDHTESDHEPTVADSRPPPGVMSPPAAPPEDLAPTGRYEPTPITRGDIPQAHRPVAVQGPPRLRRWILASAIIGLLAVGVGGALAWMASSTDDDEPVAIPLADPPTTAPAPPAEEAEPSAVASAAREEPLEEPLDQPLEDQGAGEPGDPAAAQERTAEASAEEREPQEAAEAEPEAREPVRRVRRPARPRTAPRRTTEMQEAPAMMSSSPLPGLDAFDRAVQR